jgi:hypothetical protein
VAEPESRGTRVIAVIGAATGIVATIISAFALFFTWTQAAVSTAKITYPDALRHPADCTFETTVDGFQLSGTTKLLHGDVLWVLFSGSNSPLYVMSGEPVARSSGHWSIPLTDVGSTEDKQHAVYTLWVVSANPSGNQSILDAHEHTDGKLKQLPPGVNPMTTGCAQRK